MLLRVSIANVAARVRSEDERRNTQLADFVIIDIDAILIINVYMEEVQ